MPCSICGEDGHNVKTCPVADGLSDGSKRGQRDSPRTPAGDVSAKIAMLEELQKKLSPMRDVPRYRTEWEQAEAVAQDRRMCRKHQTKS